MGAFDQNDRKFLKPTINQLTNERTRIAKVDIKKKVWKPSFDVIVSESSPLFSALIFPRVIKISVITLPQGLLEPHCILSLTFISLTNYRMSWQIIEKSDSQKLIPLSTL